MIPQQTQDQDALDKKPFVHSLHPPKNRKIILPENRVLAEALQVYENEPKEYLKVLRGETTSCGFKFSVKNNEFDICKMKCEEQLRLLAHQCELANTLWLETQSKYCIRGNVTGTNYIRVQNDHLVGKTISIVQEKKKRINIFKERLKDIKNKEEISDLRQIIHFDRSELVDQLDRVATAQIDFSYSLEKFNGISGVSKSYYTIWQVGNENPAEDVLVSHFTEKLPFSNQEIFKVHLNLRGLYRLLNDDKFRFNKKISASNFLKIPEKFTIEENVVFKRIVPRAIAPSALQPGSVPLAVDPILAPAAVDPIVAPAALDPVVAPLALESVGAPSAVKRVVAPSALQKTNLSRRAKKRQEPTEAFSLALPIKRQRASRKAKMTGLDLLATVASEKKEVMSPHLELPQRPVQHASQQGSLVVKRQARPELTPSTQVMPPTAPPAVPYGSKCCGGVACS